MIAQIKGIVDFIDDDRIIVDVNGVGYGIFVSKKVMSQLSAGDAIKLAIETHVREDHIHLYGFLTASDREWFLLLTTVQGVGTRVALAIQSTLDGGELNHALYTQDKTAFTRVSGVGPKLASRIVGELKDKMPEGLEITAPIPKDASPATDDAVSALINLGYDRGQVLKALKNIEAETVADMIRLGLKELSHG